MKHDQEYEHWTFEASGFFTNTRRRECTVKFSIERAWLLTGVFYAGAAEATISITQLPPISAAALCPFRNVVTPGILFRAGSVLTVRLALVDGFNVTAKTRSFTIRLDGFREMST